MQVHGDIGELVIAESLTIENLYLIHAYPEKQTSSSCSTSISHHQNNALLSRKLQIFLDRDSVTKIIAADTPLT